MASVIIEAPGLSPVVISDGRCADRAYIDLQEFVSSFDDGIQIFNEGRFYKIRMGEKNAYILENSKSIFTDRQYTMNIPMVKEQDQVLCIPYDGVIQLIRFFKGVVPEIFRIEDVSPVFSGLLDIPSRRANGGIKIIIDAGHGGDDSGTQNRFGIKEKDIALDVALALGELMEGEDIHVAYTRTEDVTLPLPHRVAIVNGSGADLLVSIHVNSSRNPEAKGMEIYFLNSASSDEETNELAIRENAGYNIEEAKVVVDNIRKDLDRTRILLMSKEIAEEIYISASTSLGSVRSVKQAPFYILSGITIPGVLVEIGFLSHEEEAELLESEEYREKIAEVIFTGIKNYVKRNGGFYYAEKGQ